MSRWWEPAAGKSSQVTLFLFQSLSLIVDIIRYILHWGVPGLHFLSEIFGDGGHRRALPQCFLCGEVVNNILICLIKYISFIYVFSFLQVTNLNDVRFINSSFNKKKVGFVFHKLTRSDYDEALCP